MAKQQRQLSDMPNEVLMDIIEYLDQSRDIGSATRINRHFYWLFYGYYLDFMFEKCIDRNKLGWCLSLFVTSVRVDSFSTIQYLTSQRPGQYFRRLVSGYPFKVFPRRRVTCLHLSLLSDAPRVSAHLMKFGADINQEISNYPDLTPLCLALARPKSSTQNEIDTALRIACSYALPKTVTSLLLRGADPNTLGPYGVGAIHSIVIKRLSWRDYEDLMYLSHRYADIRPWETSIYMTLSLLLHYGADVSLTTQTSRIHICDPTCWRSFDCDHRGQTALHLAAAAGLNDCVSLLLENGAKPTEPNLDGCTPLYGALSQGHAETTRILLERSSDSNPVVEVPRRGTALHIACRFAYSLIVHEILQLGVNVDVVDSQGRTPLHEVLGQTQLERKEDVVATLLHLANYGADPDITTNATTPRQLAQTHPFPVVREMFVSIKPRTSRLRTRNGLQWAYTQQVSQDPMSGVTEGNLLRGPKLPRSSPTKQRETTEQTFQPQSVIQFPNLPEAHPSTAVQEDREDSTGSISEIPMSSWAGDNTARMIKELHAPAKPKIAETRPAPSEKGIAAFPPLVEDRTKVSSVASTSAAMEHSSFWGAFARAARETSVNKNDTSRKETQSDAQPRRAAAPRGRSKWKPLQL
ncbi:ankyrin repeat-containing domain protein [Whalleya microplaca]|nr:ankyrin repeat-containing domain protein [Whalleya microplaca]